MDSCINHMVQLATPFPLWPYPLRQIININPSSGQLNATACAFNHSFQRTLKCKYQHLEYVKPTWVTPPLKTKDTLGEEVHSFQFILYSTPNHILFNRNYYMLLWWIYILLWYLINHKTSGENLFNIGHLTTLWLSGRVHVTSEMLFSAIQHMAFRNPVSCIK